ncbi:hypothetical protein [Streptomyces sp. NPDC002550]
MLSTPWRLCLTATVYHERRSDPTELLTLPGPDALDHHLLARYIPAATRTTPNPRGYTPEDVHRWLHHLTTYLGPTGRPQGTATAGAEATDIVLHELWPLAGRTRVRATDALLTTLAVLTALSIAWTATEPTTGLLAMNSALAVLAGLSATTTSSPRSPDNPFRTTQGGRHLALWLGFGLGLAVGLAYGLAAGLKVGLGGGLGLGLVLGLVGGLMREPGTSLGSRAIIRSDALFGLAGELTLGLSFGLAVGLTHGAQASRRYAVFLLCSRRRLPFRLGLFLDWAVTAGLMRHSGPAYQYRHRELQHWLRQHPHPPPLPPAHNHP